jgi:hypothetical protein
MKCHHCNKRCHSGFVSEGGIFCSEVCEDTYIKEDIQNQVQRRFQKLTEQLDAIKKTFPSYQQHPFMKVTCTEMFLCKSIATGKQREVLLQLYKMFCDAQVDAMEEMTEKCTEGTLLKYCDIAKHQFEKYKVYIDLC